MRGELEEGRWLAQRRRGGGGARRAGGGEAACAHQVAAAAWELGAEEWSVFFIQRKGELTGYAAAGMKTVR